MNNDEYLDFDQAVSFLKTTPSTLYKWLQSGKIPGHKLGRQWRFLKAELDTHVSGHGSKNNIQKDFLNLTELLTIRLKKNKEVKISKELMDVLGQYEELQAHVREGEALTYYIWITDLSREKSIDVLSHELIHVEQYATNRLIFENNIL